MILSNLPKPINREPFVKTDKLIIVARETNNKITEFEVTIVGQEPKTIKVVKDEILKAWKQVEKLVEKVK